MTLSEQLISSNWAAEASWADLPELNLLLGYQALVELFKSEPLRLHGLICLSYWLCGYMALSEQLSSSNWAAEAS